MRVAIVAPSLSRDGGAERMASQLANALSAEGHTVCVITRTPPAFGRQPLDASIDVMQMYLPRGPKGLKNLQLPAVVSSLRAHLRRWRPDVVIGNRWDCAILSLLATRGLGVPVVAWEMGYLPAASLSAPWRALRRLVYPRASAVVVLNEASVDRARTLIDAAKVRVIPFFVDEASSPANLAGSKWDEFRGGAPPHRVLALGRLGPEKGFDLLIEAYAEVADEFADWGAIIVGRGSEQPHLETLITRHRLDERMQLVGPVDEPTATFLDSDVFVLSSRHEGFGLVVVEAMAAGCAVVAFACPGGPPEIIRNDVDGILVEVGDVRALASALRRVMSDRDLRERLGASARSARDRFSRERVMRSWIALLHTVAGRSAEAA
jgi:glycosyltransferase involved in cell wall biosynthesis